ncbi:hypothetical protein SKAU_G00168720 [Synaphobranchus kaupii]|uniref:Uncharacterized protein n=1 Tax=Synaphobranchus kaupii TaxID=118154 RepID=A0A9Q1J0L7_SYNKA|nr:hypothetical protein SKAU_G00168720 [Synaphobranchus kaupii]
MTLASHIRQPHQHHRKRLAAYQTKVARQKAHGQTSHTCVSSAPREQRTWEQVQLVLTAPCTAPGHTQASDNSMAQAESFITHPQELKTGLETEP